MQTYITVLEKSVSYHFSEEFCKQNKNLQLIKRLQFQGKQPKCSWGRVGLPLRGPEVLGLLS